MHRSVEEIFGALRSDLLIMTFEEDRFSFRPPIRSSLEGDVEGDIYELMKLANTEKEARNYLKRVVELLGEYYEFPPEIDGEYYPEYYIRRYHAYHNKAIN